VGSRGFGHAGISLLDRVRELCPHVHVQREQSVCKFWLHHIALAAASGYNPRELRKIEKIVADRREQFLESWCDFFQADERRPR
jgi:hypothetical protein